MKGSYLGIRQAGERSVVSRPGRVFLAALTVGALLMSPLFVSPALAELAADPGGPYEGVVDKDVAFSGVESTPGDYRIKYWYWDFGDGTGIKRDKNATINHKYESPGLFIVQLQVEDEEGVLSAWVATTATIIDPNQTTTTTTSTSTTTTTSTTLPSTTTPTITIPDPPTTTTTTSIPFDPTTIPYDPTTTSTTTTSAPTTTTTLPPTTTTSRTVTTTPPPTTTATTTTSTEPTGQVLGQTLEATGPAAGISATAFSLVPATAAPGSEIALSLNLIARVPGRASVQFLLDGEPLGDTATLFAYGASSDTDTQAVFTRTLPTGMQIGLHRVEVVTTGATPQILASRTVGVVAGASTRAAAPDQTLPQSSNRSGLTVAIALAAVVALAGAGFAGTSRYRRKAIVRRLSP